MKKKFDDGNIVVTKADKNDSLVLMDRNLYDSKVESFISENQAVPLKKDPTNEYMSQVRKLVNSSCILDHYDKKLLINKNTSPPKLYGLAKVHKVGIPIRPVVSYSSAPAYKSAKKSNNIYLENKN